MTYENLLLSETLVSVELSQPANSQAKQLNQQTSTACLLEISTAATVNVMTACNMIKKFHRINSTL